MTQIHDEEGPPQPLAHALSATEFRDYYDQINKSHREALDSHRIQFARFHALPKTVQDSPEIPESARRICSSLTMSDHPAGTFYGSQLLALGKIMEQAGEQRARGRVEDCLDTLNILVAFLEPIEKEVKLLWRAVRAHEKPKKRATE